MPDDSSFVAVLLIGKTHMVYLCGYTSQVVVIHPVRGYTTHIVVIRGYILHMYPKDTITFRRWF